MLTIALTLFGCDQSSAPVNNKDLPEQKNTTTDSTLNAKTDQSQSSINTTNLFTLPDAEKILGEKAHLTDSSSSLKVDTFEYRSTYTANVKDRKTGKTGIIYFLVEKYASVSIAEKVYSDIRTGNEKHEGFKILHDMGDEAYFHSDGENFYFILVRKGERMLRMKVNKTTSTTSLDEFNLIAKNITATL